MQSGSSKRIAKNTAMLYFRMLFTMAVSLYTSRVVLNTLGTEDYGIYNVVGGIVIMFGFLNNAMAAATQRFLTFEMGKGNTAEIKRVFSMSITIYALVAVTVIILSETAGLWFLNTQLNIPHERMGAANWVYQFSILSFIITIFNAPYNAAIIAHERMNAFAYITIIEVILKLAVVFFLLWFGFDKLKFYAVLVFIVYLIIRTIYILYCRQKFQECRYNFLWDRKLFQKMSSFANWNLLGVFAGIAYNQGVNMLLNIFFGPAINAARSIAFQVQSAVNGFVNNFQLAVNPPITKSYAVGEKDYMYLLVFNASKYSFYLLLMLSLPIIIETEFILKLWLKTVPEYTVIFARLALIDALIYSLSGSLQTLVQATGRIKRYQLVVSGILLLNLPLSYLLLSTGFEPQSTFFISIIISLLALTGRLAVLKKSNDFPVRKFLITVVSRTIIIFFIASFIPVLVSMIIESPVEQFFIVSLLSVIAVIASVYFLGINKAEKEFLKKNLTVFFSRKKKI